MEFFVHNIVNEFWEIYYSIQKCLQNYNFETLFFIFLNNQWRREWVSSCLGVFV